MLSEMETTTYLFVIKYIIWIIYALLYKINEK